MAHDDDKPEAGDDPWAGIEAEGLPELGDGFAFSFDDQTGPEEVVVSDAGDAEPAAALDAVLDGGLEAGLDAPFDWPAENEPDAEPVATPVDDPTLEVVPDAIAEGAGDADIDDWLSSAADGDASASSVLAAGAFPEDQATAAEFPDFAAS